MEATLKVTGCPVTVFEIERQLGTVSTPKSYKLDEIRINGKELKPLPTTSLPGLNFSADDLATFLIANFQPLGCLPNRVPTA